MAHYTNVKLSVAGATIATANRAELGRPTDAHRYVLTGVKWLTNTRGGWLQYLDRDCQMTATRPNGGAVNIRLHISGVMAPGEPVHLD